MGNKNCYSNASQREHPTVNILLNSNLPYDAYPCWMAKSNNHGIKCTCGNVETMNLDEFSSIKPINQKNIKIKAFSASQKSSPKSLVKQEHDNNNNNNNIENTYSLDQIYETLTTKERKLDLDDNETRNTLWKLNTTTTGFSACDLPTQSPFYEEDINWYINQKNANRRNSIHTEYSNKRRNNNNKSRFQRISPIRSKSEFSSPTRLETSPNEANRHKVADFPTSQMNYLITGGFHNTHIETLEFQSTVQTEKSLLKIQSPVRVLPSNQSSRYTRYKKESRYKGDIQKQIKDSKLHPRNTLKEDNNLSSFRNLRLISSEDYTMINNIHRSNQKIYLSDFENTLYKEEDEEYDYNYHHYQELNHNNQYNNNNEYSISTSFRRNSTKNSPFKSIPLDIITEEKSYDNNQIERTSRREEGDQNFDNKTQKPIKSKLNMNYNAPKSDDFRYNNNQYPSSNHYLTDINVNKFLSMPIKLNNEDVIVSTYTYNPQGINKHIQELKKSGSTSGGGGDIEEIRKDIQEVNQSQKLMNIKPKDKELLAKLMQIVVNNGTNNNREISSSQSMKNSKGFCSNKSTAGMIRAREVGVNDRNKLETINEISSSYTFNEDHGENRSNPSKNVSSEALVDTDLHSQRYIDTKNTKNELNYDLNCYPNTINTITANPQYQIQLSETSNLKTDLSSGFYSLLNPTLPTNHSIDPSNNNNNLEAIEIPNKDVQIAMKNLVSFPFEQLRSESDLSFRYSKLDSSQDINNSNSIEDDKVYLGSGYSVLPNIQNMTINPMENNQSFKNNNPKEIQNSNKLKANELYLAYKNNILGSINPDNISNTNHITKDYTYANDTKSSSTFSKENKKPNDNTQSSINYKTVTEKIEKRTMKEDPNAFKNNPLIRKGNPPQEISHSKTPLLDHWIYSYLKDQTNSSFSSNKAALYQAQLENNVDKSYYNEQFAINTTNQNNLDDPNHNYSHYSNNSRSDNHGIIDPFKISNEDLYNSKDFAANAKTHIKLETCSKNQNFRQKYAESNIFSGNLYDNNNNNPKPELTNSLKLNQQRRLSMNY